MSTVQSFGFLESTIQRLIRAFAPAQIVLFGSYAKGSELPGSDVDLLVVANFESSEYHLRRARQLVRGAFPPVDIVLCTEQQVADADHAASPFLASVIAHGVVLYTRD